MKKKLADNWRATKARFVDEIIRTLTKEGEDLAESVPRYIEGMQPFVTEQAKAYLLAAEILSDLKNKKE